jgi:hypothetical protein
MFPTRVLERRHGSMWIGVQTASTPEGHRRLDQIHAAYAEVMPANEYRIVELSHLKNGEPRVVTP